jgi:parallel beta-helix repeat protein
MGAMSRRFALRAGVVGAAAAGTAAFATRSPARAEGASEEPPQGWISVTAYGAVGDGTHDDTAAIRAAFEAAGTAEVCPGIYFPPGRVYRVSDEVRATGLSDFVISGYGATVALAGGAPSLKGAKAILRVDGCHRFKVLGLCLRDSDRLQQYDGLRVAMSSAGVVDGVVVENTRFNGIVVYDAVAGRSENITIANCTTEGTRFGITSNGKDVRITDNHVAMDWPSTAEADAKGGVWSAPSDYYDGICVWAGGDRTVISGNTVTDVGQSGVYTERCTNIVVADNTIVGAQLRGIEVDGSARATVAGGITTGVTITGNVVSKCQGNINLLNASDVTVVGNRSENPSASLARSCIAVNAGANKIVVASNHARQAHPTFPAIYVHEESKDVTLAWNGVEAVTQYQAPSDTVIIQRGGPGQIHTTGGLTASGLIVSRKGIGVGNSTPARTPGQVVRKIEVFDADGKSLGFVPVYASIA